MAAAERKGLFYHEKIQREINRRKNKTSGRTPKTPDYARQEKYIFLTSIHPTESTSLLPPDSLWFVS